MDKTTRLLTLSLSTLIQQPTQNDHSSPIEEASEYQKLLPSNTVPFIKPQDRQPKDTLFSFIYAICFTIWLVTGWVSPHSIDIDWRQLSLLISVSLLSGILWLLLLSQFAKFMIYATALLVPVSMTLFSVVLFSGAMYRLLYTPLPSYMTNELYLILVISVSLAFIGIYLILQVMQKKSLAANMTRIVQLSCSVLHANPRLLLLSSLIFIAQILFTILWAATLSYSLSWLSWTIFMYFWTSSILLSCQKMVIASIVGQWYFERFEMKSDHTWEHFSSIISKQTGSIVFGGLILGSIELSKKALQKCKDSGFLRAFATTLLTWIKDLSSYSLVYAGITGESLLSGCYKTSGLLSRNMVYGLMTHSMSRLLSFYGKLLVSMIVGLWMYSGSEVIAGVSALVTFYCIGTVTSVLDYTIDATFVCFLMDLDMDQCHSEGAHRIFSESLC